MAWWAGNSNGSINEVKTRAPNTWGFYDLSGNVYEWVWDYYNAYTSNPKINPAGGSSGSARGCRGGGWIDGARDVRLSDRHCVLDTPDLKTLSSV